MMHCSHRPASVFLLGALILAFGAGCGQKKTATTARSGPQKQPVEVVPVTRRDLVESLSLVGSLAPNETAQLRAEISGQIRSVNFEEGQKVLKGQVLLRIDDAELRAQVAQAEARFHLAELSLKRSENLTESRSMSQAEADRTRSEFASAEAEVQLLNVRLGKMEIKAPFDGFIGARAISPGDYVTAATVITNIDDVSRLKIDFQVPERFAEQVKPGSTFVVRAYAPGGDTQAAGEVYFTSSVIDRATRSVQVKGYIVGMAAGLKPGMFANIDLVLRVHSGVLTVPEGAILSTAAGASVIALKEDKGGMVAEFVPVKLGLRSRGLVELQPLTGQFADQQLVVASGVGGVNIFPGSPLEPRPLKAEFRVAE